MKIILANPRGFCAGVDRAIAIVEKAIEKHGAPIYVKNEVVHNKFVVQNLKAKGAIFVDDLSGIPAGSVIIFSAHGVSKKVKNQANNITEIVYDATCPLVTKVHKEVIRRDKNNHQIILIGHKGHPEVEGTLGQAENVILVESPSDVDNLNLQNQASYTTQTTLSIDDTLEIVDKLKAKYPNIDSPKKDDICYATQNRQDAVKNIMQSADILLVLGSKNSSNSNRLREIADKVGKKGYLIDNENEIDKNWLKNAKTIGITAGASAPEVLVQNVIKFLNPNEVVEFDGVFEDVNFAIPKNLSN
jgi:4-hydroxy-3-methylbut-2-enyl diphosphate reductase